MISCQDGQVILRAPSKQSLKAGFYIVLCSLKASRNLHLMLREGFQWWNRGNDLCMLPYVTSSEWLWAVVLQQASAQDAMSVLARVAHHCRTAAFERIQQLPVRQTDGQVHSWFSGAGKLEPRSMGLQYSKVRLTPTSLGFWSSMIPHEDHSELVDDINGEDVCLVLSWHNMSFVFQHRSLRWETWATSSHSACETGCNFQQNADSGTGRIWSIEMKRIRSIVRFDHSILFDSMHRKLELHAQQTLRCLKPCAGGPSESKARETASWYWCQSVPGRICAWDRVTCLSMPKLWLFRIQEALKHSKTFSNILRQSQSNLNMHQWWADGTACRCGMCEFATWTGDRPCPW